MRVKIIKIIQLFVSVIVFFGGINQSKASDLINPVNCNIEINYSVICNDQATTDPIDDVIDLTINFDVTGITTDAIFEIYIDTSLVTTIKENNNFFHFGIKADNKLHTITVVNPLDTLCKKTVSIGNFNQCSVVCPHPDFETLMALYDSTGGENWTNNYGWKEAKEGKNCDPCSGWYGVSCINNRVSSISLRSNNLKGTIPSLIHLEYIQNFDCSWNQLIGFIPSLVGLNNLKSFKCSLNQLIGSIPSLIGLNNLETFSCGYNQLSGTIPQLSGLNNLQNFWCDNNQLTGSIPSLTGLNKLQYFSCSFNQITGTIPTLNALNNLQEFNCSRNQLTGSFPSLDGLNNLQYFSCSFNQITGSIPTLNALNNLQEFYCSVNQITGSIPILSGLNNLFRFECYNNRLSGSIPLLSGLNSLGIFSCSGNQLTGSIPPLSGLNNLGSFSCYDNQLTGSIPSLSGLNQLISFYCDNNQLTGSIPSLSQLNNLTYFGCSSNQLTGTIPILDGLTNLREFVCNYNQINGPIPTLTGLNKLQIFYCYNNLISGSIPSLAGLNNLQNYWCFNNQLTGILPSLTGLDSLQSFVAYNNDLAGCIPQEYCTKNGIDILHNPKLPFQGNLNLYCSTSGNQTCDDGDSRTIYDQIVGESCLCIGEKIATCSLSIAVDTINIAKYACSDNNTPNDVSDDFQYVVINISDSTCLDTVVYSYYIDNQPIKYSHPFECRQDTIRIPSDGLPHSIVFLNNHCADTLSVGPFFPCQDSCQHPDFEALMTLYDGTAGDQWTQNYGWKEAKEGKNCDPCSGWFGVTCNNNRVINLSLNNNNLKGSLSSLSGLDSLQYFSCHSNQLSGSIPPLSSLGNLLGFECSSNQISGSIPSLSGLKLLRGFNCSENNLTGEIPNLFGLDSLRLFGCSRNKITGPIPQLNSLVNLEGFYCFNNNLIGSIPKLTNLQKLNYFMCDSNFLNGTISDISGLQNLTLFYCSYNQLQDTIPNLRNLPSLHAFNCANNLLHGNIPQITDLPSLAQFRCNNNKLTGPLPTLQGLNSLGLFYAQNNYLEGCISDEYCKINIVSLVNNPKLPFGGNLNLYCSNSGIASCDDGNPETINDRISGQDCECSGYLCPVLNANPDTFIIVEKDLVLLDILNNDFILNIGDSTNIELKVEVLEGKGRSINTIVKGLNVSVQIDSIWDGEIRLNYTLTTIGLPSCSSTTSQSIYLINEKRHLENLCQQLEPIDDIFELRKQIKNTLSLTENDLLANKLLTSLGPDYEYEITSIRLPSNNGFQYSLYPKEGIELYIEKDWIDSLILEYDLCLLQPCQACQTARIYITNEAIKDLTFTTIISPDGDGMNDHLRFSIDSQIDEFEIWIYNRWGDQVYHSTNYTNDWSANGHPGGVYFYVVKYQDLIIKKALTVVK